MSLKNPKTCVCVCVLCVCVGGGEVRSYVEWCHWLPATSQQQAEQDWMEGLHSAGLQHLICIDIGWISQYG